MITNHIDWLNNNVSPMQMYLILQGNTSHCHCMIGKITLK